MSWTDFIRNKAKQNKKRIVFPEGNEPRTLKAAEIILKEEIADVILLGDVDVMHASGCDLTGAVMINLEKASDYNEMVQAYFELRQKKGISMDEAKKCILNPIYYGTMMVKLGKADGLVSGAVHSTGDTVRPALQILKTAPGISIVSSCFIMILPNSQYGQDGVMIYGDCGVVPNPNVEELASIAIACADSAVKLTEIKTPYVAMLSYSTKGSAKHEMVDKVVEATKLAQQKAPHLILDGELQGDAALVASVGAQKAPGSPVAGKANVLVFPDIQSGNIAYKLTQRLAGAEAIGPIIQGMAKPVNDLSRGCNVEDIVNVTAVTAAQAQE